MRTFVSAVVAGTDSGLHKINFKFKENIPQYNFITTFLDMLEMKK